MCRNGQVLGAVLCGAGIGIFLAVLIKSTVLLILLMIAAFLGGIILLRN